MEAPYNVGTSPETTLGHIVTVNTSTTLTEEKNAAFETFLPIFIYILFGTVAIVGTAGNLLVITVVLSNKQMRNSTNILIINLAVADLLFILICVPFTAVSLTVYAWPFGDIFCKIYQYLLNVTCYASVYTLVLMSLDRYLAVVHPIWSMNIRTTSNALYITLISWVIILALTVPIIFEHGIFSTIEGDFCTNLKIAKEGNISPHGRLFYGLFFAFGYLIPLALVCVLYGLMLRRLMLRMTPGGNASAESMRGKKRVTKMIVIVVCIFAICWLPVHIRFLIQYFGKYYASTGNYIFATLATCLAYTNSCINPILYAFLSENFRKSFRRLLCCHSAFQPVQLEFERTHVPHCNKGIKVNVADDQDEEEEGNGIAETELTECLNTKTTKNGSL